MGITDFLWMQHQRGRDMPTGSLPVVALGEVKGRSIQQLNREVNIQDDNLRRLEGVVDIEFKHELF